MIQFGRLREETARAYDRHGIKSYRMHTDEPAGVLEVEVGGVTMKFNVIYKTLMIYAKNMTEPRSHPFERWRNNPQLIRWGIDRRWWSTFRGPILATLDLIDAQTAEPPAAVENPDAQVDHVPAAAVDELLQFQTVVNVSMREGAHAAPV